MGQQNASRFKQLVGAFFPASLSGGFFAAAKTTSVERSSRIGIKSLRSQACT
jgi:hypothetical protein